MTGFNFPWPLDEKWDAKSSFIEAALASAELHSTGGVFVWAEKPSRVLRTAKAVLPSIISSEENNGIVTQVEFGEEVNYLPEVVIDHGYHGGVVLHVLRDLVIFDPRLIPVVFPGRVIAGNIKHAMGWGDREIAEEGGVPVFPDEFETLFHDGVMGIGFPGATTSVSGQLHFFAVTDQVRGIKRMSMDLIVVTKKDIESVFFWNTGRVPASGSPLAKSSGCVTLVLQERGDSDFICTKWSASVIRPNRSVTGVLSGHKVAA